MAKIALRPGPFVMPMPTVLIGALVDGRANFMPAAFCGIVNYKPVVVCCGLNPAHWTCKGIEANGSYSINIVTPSMVEVADYCGLRSGKDVDKSGLFETFTGDLASAPMITSCPLTMECRVLQTLPFDVDTGYVAEVVSVHADDDVLTDGKVDWGKIRPMIFTFPDAGYWQLGAYVAKAWSVGKGYAE